MSDVIGEVSTPVRFPDPTHLTSPYSTGRLSSPHLPLVTPRMMSRQAIVRRNLSDRHNVRNTNVLKAITESVLTGKTSRFLTDFQEMQFEKNKNLVTRFYVSKQQSIHMISMFKFYQFAIPIPQMCLADKTRLAFRYYAYKRARRERVIQSLLPNLSNVQLSQLDLELIQELEMGTGTFGRPQNSFAPFPSSDIIDDQTSHILNDISSIPTISKPMSEVSIARESELIHPKVTQGKARYGALLDNERWMKCVLEDYDLGQSKGESKDVTVKIKTKQLQSFQEVNLPAEFSGKFEQLQKRKTV